MKIIKAPNKIPDEGYFIFLAGSIEQGKAENWQDKVTKLIKQYMSDITVLNSRRNNWNSTWVQSIDNPQFRKQVEWELKGLKKADWIILYFDPKTKSPITLLELGLFAHTRNLIVCCPEGFWRKGNVDIVCKQYNITQVDSLDELKDVFILWEDADKAQSFTTWGLPN